MPLISFGDGSDASCGEIDVPADWDRPDGDHPAFLKRIRATEAPSRQLWMLNGGSGAPGAGFESTAAGLVAADPNLEVFLLDHRGTGRSSRLGCPIQEADDSHGGFDLTADEAAACITSVEAEWGDT